MDKSYQPLIINICNNLKENDFMFSVEAQGTPWDVYRFCCSGVEGTIAFRIINNNMEIGILRKGHLSETEIIDTLNQRIN
jgi:hypothetical protein